MTDIKFRQSGIGSFRLCPESFRLDFLDLMPDKTSDATHAGTGLHAGVEHVLRTIKADNIDVFILRADSPLFHAGEAVMMEYIDKCELEGVPLVKQTSWDAVRNRMDKAWVQWVDWFLDSINGGFISCEVSAWKIEYQFEFEYQGITFQGTFDFFDGATLFDWKSGEVPQFWEVQRWAPQPTIYALAVRELMQVDEMPAFVFVYPNGKQKDVEDDEGNKTRVLPFPEEIEIERTQADVDRMMLEIDSILTVESKYGWEESWPLRTDTWFCSEKWCGNYNDCIGAVMKGNDDG